MTLDDSLRASYDRISDFVDNWRRWGRSEYALYPYQPVCITAKIGEGIEPHEYRPDVNVIEAEQFEDIVQSIRWKERRAFLFYTLGFAPVDGRRRYASNALVASNRLKISRMQYYRYVNNAVKIIINRLKLDTQD